MSGGSVAASIDRADRTAAGARRLDAGSGAGPAASSLPGAPARPATGAPGADIAPSPGGFGIAAAGGASSRLGRSSRTSWGATSSRTRMKIGKRNNPSGVHSPYSTSTTISGRTQVTGPGMFGRLANGEVVVSSGA